MRFRLLASACAVMANLAGLVQAQEPSSSALDRVAGATGFIRRGTDKQPGGGASFLVRKAGKTGWFLTASELLGNGDRFGLILHSRTKTETVLVATVDYIDAATGLALLHVDARDAKDLPTPLEIGGGGKVAPGTRLFPTGFSIGSMNSTSDSPAACCSKAEVVGAAPSAEGGPAAQLELSGEIDPGCEGGAVLEASGRLAGLLRRSAAGSNRPRLVQVDSLAGMLQVHVTKASVEGRGVDRNSTRLEASVEFSDPTESLKAALVAYVPADQIPSDPQPDKSGRWERVSTSMKDLPLKREQGRTAWTGSAELKRPPDGEGVVQYLWQLGSTEKSGRVTWTAPQVARIGFSNTADPKAPRTAQPGGGVKPGEAAAHGPEPASRPIAPSQKAGLRAVLAELLLAPDGESLFVLDLSDGRVHKLEAAGLKVLASVEVSENATDLACSPDGTSLYVAARGSPKLDVRGRESADSRSGGLIQVLDSASLKLTSSFPIDPDPVDLETVDERRLLVRSTGEYSGPALVDVKEQRSRLLFGHAGDWTAMRVHPGARRAYGGAGTNVHSFPLDAEPSPTPRPDDLAFPKLPPPLPDGAGRVFEVSPDGTFMLHPMGFAFRLFAAPGMDLRVVAKVAPFTSATFGLGSEVAYVATLGGRLQELSMKDFQPRRVFSSDLVCSRLRLDAKRSRLYALAMEKDPYNPVHSGFGGGPSWTLRHLADVVAFDVKEK
ncbi:MAG: trypsin-like peptidase domain-containing protein [Planctomycetes bacterium]|nr:trypsin-like peptidase domain-containing protein [Planctomycetota bacterium]